MSERRSTEELAARLTAGGTPAATANEIQMMTFQHISKLKVLRQCKCETTYLFPQEVPQVEHTTTLPSQVKEASEHHNKQYDVGYKRDDDI
jgi:hypothetical protein